MTASPSWVTVTAPISRTARTAARSASSTTCAIFGCPYAAEPGRLAEELKADEAIAEADTLLLTVPNQLGVDRNTHAIEGILRQVAPALGWQ